MKNTFSVELLARQGKKRLFTAHWGTQNHEWLHHLKEDDYCVFVDVSMPGPPHTILEVLADHKWAENLYFLCNDYQVYRDRKAAGLNAIFVNQNAFIDDTIFTIDPAAEKKYDAVYNARLRPVKRHSLARKVGDETDLALIVGFHTPGLDSVPESEIPKSAMRNEYQLLPSTVCRILNECRIGLILSAAEGACFASSEYLLTGLPVVSTKSTGGRDLWYDDYNAIVTEADEDAILEAVQELLNNPRDPYKVRESHIRKMYTHRQKFIDQVLERIFPGALMNVEQEHLFNMFDFRRFMVFQNKLAWKTRPELKEKFEADSFDCALDFDAAPFKA